MKESALSIREKMYIVIFRSDTKAGRLFDLVLLWMIVGSVLAVTLESVPIFQNMYGERFHSIEWAFTLFFTVEYVARVYCAPKRSGYIFSFLGIIDLLAILPGYIGLIYQGTHVLMVIRAFRLLRVFRLLKLSRHVSEAQVLINALQASRAKITVFLGAVLTLTLISGSVMYMIEGEENGFTSIPQSVYWAIVTMTTVGYGDISPKTSLGQFIASLIMIAGYGILAVPTGIVSVELQEASRRKRDARTCPGCHSSGHESIAKFCRDCGTTLPGPAE